MIAPVASVLGIFDRGVMALPELEILYEDNHCLAVAKPGGVLSTHFQGKEETIDRAVKQYLKTKHDKPGNVFLGIVHRLDRLVSGVLLFARTSKAAARLAKQFREGSVEKVYWAIVEGDLDKIAGTLEDWLIKNEKTHHVEVVEPRTRGSRQALLHFQKRGEHGDLTWLEVRPQTGRTHQLRVQLAHLGYPIYGDARYGSIHTFEKAIALHARSLTFLHPVRYEPITLTAEVPRKWRGRFAYLLQGQAK
ncbi:MAG TPA: RluA family pseudouridine synthase [Gemmataceae bacterium]|nr:RluA family pseudouridine synthase [Gemmataceae bacterium]